LVCEVFPGNTFEGKTIIVYGASNNLFGWAKAVWKPVPFIIANRMPYGLMP
jgi:hypothetical protein